MCYFLNGGFASFLFDFTDLKRSSCGFSLGSTCISMVLNLPLYFLY